MVGVRKHAKKKQKLPAEVDVEELVYDSKAVALQGETTDILWTAWKLVGVVTQSLCNGSMYDCCEGKREHHPPTPHLD